MLQVKSIWQRIDAKRIRRSMRYCITIHLLMVVATEGLDPPGCKFLSCWCARLLVAALLPPPGATTTAPDGDEAIGISFELVLLALLLVVVVVPVMAWPVWPSTGFLERWRPLFMCRSQYFWSATASLEHRHFFPSVLRHLPGSGSLLENPIWKEPHPTWYIQYTKASKVKREKCSQKQEKIPILDNFRLCAEVSFFFVE